jgi:hypothetical protein
MPLTVVEGVYPEDRANVVISSEWWSLGKVGITVVDITEPAYIKLA